MKTKRSWAHAYVCVSCQHHNRTTTSLSVVRSASRSVHVCSTCLFFSLARSAAKLYYFLHTIQYVPGSGRFKKLFQVLLAIGGGLLSFGRASYYITTTTTAAAA